MAKKTFAERSSSSEHLRRS